MKGEYLVAKLDITRASNRVYVRVELNTNDGEI